MLAIGDVAVIVAVSAVHRGEAFDACRLLIDRLKHEVPIWKHQTVHRRNGRMGRGLLILRIPA